MGFSAKTKGSLSQAFAAVALSTPGQIFMRNAGRISGLSFLAGDLLLGYQYLAPAIAFIASDAALAISDFQGKKPNEILPGFPITDTARKLLVKAAPHGLRAAGIACVSAAAMLGFLTRNEPGHVALLTSSSMIALQGVSWIFEKQFHQESHQ